MHYGAIHRILGIFLMLFSITLMPPLCLAWFSHDTAWIAFSWALLITAFAGFLLWLFLRKKTQPLRTRDGFLLIVLFWMTLSIFGALPFVLSPIPHLSFTNAVFEAMSGLTTTGATILPGFDYLPHPMKLYHQQLQFVGGMAIIVLAIAILPTLRVGGLQLYQSEIPGPVKNTQLTPRMTQTVKALWYIYVGLTLLCILIYWVCGMKFFDAVGEGFATVSTGGFSMHDDSFAHYHSSLINSMACVFMILGSTNFSLHFVALRQQSLKNYWRDREFRTFLLILLVSSLITTVTLLCYQVYDNPKIAVYKAFFNAISLGTNTGFVTAPFQSWPTFIPILFMLTGMIGGCAASTSGGIKVIRLLLLYRQGLREVKRLIHPTAVLPLKLGERVLSDALTQAVWGYVAIFFSLFILLILLLMGAGLDFDSAVGAIVACFANLGVGIGDIADNFVSLSSPTKWILIIAMLGGRLEIFTLLLLVTPSFWRK